MENKHGFLNNNGHNKSVFENFCNATSEFEAEDLLEILFNRYWDDSDLIKVTDLIDDILKEEREPRRYKLRAECLHDVMELLKLIRVEDYSIVNVGMSDVVLSFSSKEDWFKIDEKFLEIPDSHVMRETFTYERDYTGDRDGTYRLEGNETIARGLTYKEVMVYIDGKYIPNILTCHDIKSWNASANAIGRIYKETD